MTRLYLAITFIIITLSLKSLAQPPGFSSSFNRMMSNQMMHMTMTRMMNNTWFFGLNYQNNATYTFSVLMKDSTVKTVKSKVYADTALHKSYIIYVNKSVKKNDPTRQQKIYADQTAGISRKNTGFGTNDLVEGFATDSCWLFKVVIGKINVYSFLSETENLDESYLRAFQFGDGKVMKLDSTTLSPIIKNDPKAYKYFKKGKFYKAIDKYNSD